MRIRSITMVLAMVAAGTLVSAPSAHARGLANCFSATGSLAYSNSSTYEVRITDRCGLISTTHPDFGEWINYTIDVGAYCTSRSGSVSRGTLGASERIDISCLTPSTHYPTITFSSFSDGSYNPVQLPTITVRRPETPRPVVPIPTPTPVFTPAPLPTPSPSEPTRAPSVISPGSGGSGAGEAKVDRALLPAATSVSYVTKRRGTSRPTARLANGELSVRIKTNLKPRSEFSVQVLGPWGMGEEMITKPGGVVERRAFQDWYNFPVRKNGIVTFTVPVTAANEITLRDQRGKTFLRLSTTSGCLADSIFTLVCP